MDAGYGAKHHPVSVKELALGLQKSAWRTIKWRKGTAEWLSSHFARVVDIAKLRWRIERDCQDLKQELGIGQFEGRGWRSFHHHATLCIAAYGFLISERETIPLQDLVPPHCSRNLPYPTVSDPEAPPLRPERHIPNSIATSVDP
jgi:hypothetical protein